jgi:hypothetical protein
MNLIGRDGRTDGRDGRTDAQTTLVAGLERKKKNFGFRFSIPKIPEIPKIPNLRGRSREKKKVSSA